ncbi:type A chloramphenicol O-acetyltransferase [Galactobacter caseinivorans]|uniref:Chloramphenicol acetyltransferase n=1 Tax=Galactobacter caseinivorans TaxID=2676123 RepID=A0A496PK96_9MICC|nr:type A chloramphenicol O-acetyltransferase [Galactobacter caseinivorans]RKW70929.1 type A chloramphenicol O-acetyltransferase [Galactobacter caseinivorans]
MDIPTPIDLSTWPRREHFEHYRTAVPCSYALTVELDVTEFAEALRRSPRKSYVAQIWALATVVNRHDEFRMSINTAGEVGVWPVLHPAFTVFNPDRETFASVWTPYSTDFSTFHDAAADTLAMHRTATAFFPQGPPPANAFDVSSLPWTSFTGFNLNIAGSEDHLLPIFTLGRYVRREGRTLLPVAAQIHHAAADGFHASRLLNELQELFANPSWID